MSERLLLGPVREIALAVSEGGHPPDDLAAAAEAAYRRSDAGSTPLHAFLSTDFSGGKGATPPAGPLAGVPLAVKDNLSTSRLPTTCGSRLLEGYRAPFDATVVRRAVEAGARIVGKTNLDEFAMGSSTEHSAFGPTRNPHDRSRVPGGSSGGSAAAVAAGIVPLALGSDTGGSVRQPAAFCGLVGIRPTYGRVSRYGLVAHASSLDQVGVLGRSVADAALLLEVVGGPDPLDSTCSPRPAPPLLAKLEEGVDGMVVGIPDEYLPASLGPAAEGLVRAAGQRLAELGAELRAVSLRGTAEAIPAYYVIALAEAASNLARFDGLRFGRRELSEPDVGAVTEATRALFGVETKRRVLLGTYLLSAGYAGAVYERARAVRARIARDFSAAFTGGVDVLLTPTTPTPAFRLGERMGDPYSMYLSDVFTVPASLAGLPALSVPIGEIDGLPFGGQLMAPPWEEARLVRVARALEAALAEGRG